MVRNQDFAALSDIAIFPSRENSVGIEATFIADTTKKLRTYGSTMKDGIHPDYHPVVFYDVGADFKFLTQSTMGSKETIQWEDGNEYPLVTIDISSASHPFYTGKMKYVDSAGRVEKFQKKYGWGKKDKE